MASIIIDGYNVIGILHKDLRSEREEFVDTLIGYSKAKGHEVWVVFDGWKEGGAKESKKTSGGVHIIYSAVGEKADAVIKRIITERRRNWIVISSDRDIQGFAWTKGSVPVDSDEFIAVIGLDDEEEPRRTRTGNTKKEKEIKKALDKLWGRSPG